MKINLTNKIMLFVLLLISSSTAMAQTVIDEDFLDNIEINAKVLWLENIPAFANNTVPDKYKD